jgi:hypothetical protein
VQPVAQCPTPFSQILSTSRATHSMRPLQNQEKQNGDYYQLELDVFHFTLFYLLRAS